jgi:hypothetical protein
MSNFQILISNGRMRKCGGYYENVKLQMGNYRLKTHMLAIESGCDIVLGVEWLGTLGRVTMDFKELYMSFVQDSHTHTLKGLQVSSPEIISSHWMEKLLKKGHYGIIAQFYAIQVVQNTTPAIHLDMQRVLD